MPFAQWLRPPRRTLTVFLCLMIVLGSALGWLGWQVIERDRLVERGQVQDRVERSADHIAAALLRSLADLDHRAAVQPRSYEHHHRRNHRDDLYAGRRSYRDV